MSLKTKLYAGLTSTVLLSAVATMPAFAAGSASVGMSVVDKGNGGVVHVDSTEEIIQGSYTTLEDEFDGVKSQDVLNQIADLNNGASLGETLGAEFSDYALLTEVKDLNCWNADGSELDNHIGVYLEVPNMTAGMDISVLHYSEVSEKWELIEPEEVNFETKEINVDFNDLSPVGVVYNTKTVKAPVETGVQTNSMMYKGLAVAALGGIAVLGFKMKK